MKQSFFSILFVVLLYSCGCTSGNNNGNVHSGKGMEFSKEFESFLINFQEKKLPLAINRIDLQLYGLTVYDSVDEKYKTSSFFVIQNKFFKFICKDTSNINSAIRGLYKIQFPDYFILLYAKDIISNDEDPETWIMLNSYDNGGSLLDTLCIAGSKLDQIEKFVSITDSINIEINIKTYQFLPDNPDVPALYAVELNQNHIIDEKGRFKLISSTQKKDYFILDNNEYKVYKKD
jgi:hypothetical protein